MAGKTGTIAAIITGAAVGAAIGILFAPEEGTKTRKKIKEGVGSKADEIKDKISELTETVKSKFGHTKQDIESGLNSLVANVDSKADEIIETLERKLQDLKAAKDKATEKA
ncbi:YtxH domain-containing protein [Flavobacterium rhizosphaerae]|uniref:YtxH domain-containing protein n=1 Tax=Flavobacterium rhizosphaerae TaxID=3163298 RepID=A0ABW8YXW7_9FLAO